MRDFDLRARTFVRGVGTMLEDQRGHRLYDAVSSIWTTVHGHCHPRIVSAIAAQAAVLDHATLLGAANPLAIALADRICTLADMDRAFFAADGASAVEAAVKIVLQYWQNRGEPQRCRFLRLSNAYHGDTVGAMSVSDIALFKGRFESVTFAASEFDPALLTEPEVAAVVVEPLVQAAAGMRATSAHVYDALRGAKPLVIADEIATGFGRTGTMFAFEQTPLRPDLLCLGKSITGGTLALSATLVRRPLYAAFLGAYDAGLHFFHGHSYAGNPIACAAALASLDLFVEERTLERAHGIARRAASHLDRICTHGTVRAARQTGTMIGVEIAAETIDRRGAPTPAWRIADALYDAGHFTRPIGDVLQFVPPLCSTDGEVDEFFDALERALDRAAA